MSWKDKFPKENRYFETDSGILYNMDCLDLLPILPQESIDLIVTDPPYGVGSNEKNGIGYKDKFYDVNKISKCFYNVLKDNSRAYVFTAQKTFIDVVETFENNGFCLHQTLIWFRKNLAGGTKKKTYDFTSSYEQILNLHKGKPQPLKKEHLVDVFEFLQPQSNYSFDKRFHVHQKPLKLIEHLIYVSTEEDDIVFDPFAGSGTTAVAAEKLGRKWIAVEIQSEYCQIIKNRIKQYSSIKPLLGFS